MTARRCRITVWDHADRLHGSALPPSMIKHSPVRYDVEAWCVGGVEGVRAYFIIGDLLYEADGDDGNWWLVSVCHKDWLKSVLEALTGLSKEMG